MWLFFKNFILMILLPGTVTVWLPWFILNHAHVSVRWTLWRALALLPSVFGAGILLRCIWDFAVFGRGTLAPIDPPKHLVVRGLYRYVRNPMYIGMVLVVLGEAWFFKSGALLVQAAVAFIVVHTFVLFYEEPHLRRQFGRSYASYCQDVNRWLPRKPKPHNHPNRYA
jgi:protein-S-isoprenylcysteine O-methyltransferase Ste14